MAHFLFLGDFFELGMQQAPPHLTDLVRGAVEAVGYELVGVEYLSRQKAGHLLRVYIDSEHGIGVEDCRKVSHQISGVLEVEDPIKSEYALEVSSPGLDRPLFEIRHFEQFVGHTARIKLNAALDGRSNYKGIIVSVDGDDIVVQVEDEPVRLPFAQMASARLVPKF